MPACRTPTTAPQPPFRLIRIDRRGPTDSLYKLVLVLSPASDSREYDLPLKGELSLAEADRTRATILRLCGEDVRLRQWPDDIRQYRGAEAVASVLKTLRV